MIGYFMNKPIQGDLFRKFIDQIMGVILTQDPGPGRSNPGNGTNRKSQPGKGKQKKGKECFFLKFGPAGKAAPQ